MTQAQINQNQPEQNTTDLIAQPLFNDSPDLFLEAMDQGQPTTNSEQIEHNIITPKSAHFLNYLIMIRLVKHNHGQNEI